MILTNKIKRLEQKIFEHAQVLEFEEAAKLKDEIHRIQEQNMGLIKK